MVPLKAGMAQLLRLSGQLLVMTSGMGPPRRIVCRQLVRLELASGRLAPAIGLVHRTIGRIGGAYMYGTFVSGRMSGQLCVNAQVYPADYTIMAILFAFSILLFCKFVVCSSDSC